MERCMWKGKLAPGTLDEYVRRHDAIWPEVIETFNKAGIHNYTVWIVGNDELIGYYEVDTTVEYADSIKAASQAFTTWSKYMSDLFITLTDPVTGGQLRGKQVFRHE